MAPSLISAVLRRHKPSSWSDVPRYEDVVLVPLAEDSTEYLMVVQNVSVALRNKIHSVDRVQNPFLWGSYMLKKEEYINYLGFGIAREEKLFHATAEENVYSIVKNNFDWRRAKRTRYGHGVSFSPSADYANTYCNQKAGCRRALILARVLVKMATKGNYGAKLPPPPSDTTTGKNGNVVVKYADNEFYPEYVVYYTN
jgi:hypothetical protein